jgi:hypothetical protein
MSGRRTFFSFHYQRDIWRTAIVRNAHVVTARVAAGWTDASIWETARKKGAAAIHKLIDGALEGTSVTVVLIGAQTAYRRYVSYEIRQSIARGNGLLGIHIDGIPNQKGDTDDRGEVPKLLSDAGAPSYDWDRSTFAALVERAAIKAGHPCLKHRARGCSTCKFVLWFKS